MAIATSAVRVTHKVEPSTVSDLVALTKPRVSVMVLATFALGAAIAPGHVRLPVAAASMLGTALIVAAANVLNMWLERDTDAQMARTAGRPLAAGRMRPNVALVFGIALALASVPAMLAAGPLVAALGLFAFVDYVAIYTPLKRRTWLALPVGAIAGAIPPAMGWATTTGTLGTGGLLIFAIQLLWQMPHSAAIALFRVEEYAEARLRVVSVERGEEVARRVTVWGSWVLVAASLLPYVLHLAGAAYLAVAGALGAGVLLLTRRTAEPTTTWARRIFRASIVHQMGLLIAWLLDRTS